MAIINQPTPLSNELAWNGDKNPIPQTNDGEKGLFSIEYGFPYKTQQPLAQGGIPPQRNDFNGVLNLLSKFIVYFQNGGVFAYNASMDYSVGMLVRSGDRLYVCKAENGANTTAGVQGVSNSNYWNEITLEDTLGNTLANQLKTVLVTEAEAASNTVDWNTLTESRTYKISGATFSSTYHQPVGASGNGELVVLKNGTDTIVQVYYANSVQASQAGAFHRIYFNGAWTEWVYDITNKGGKIDGSLTLSGDLTADNITANGDLSVTGNSNINGKLTVDSIEVSEGLTIGGAEPLGQDAIVKLQNQIISPNQTLYIDSINGSDETGDGTSSKPYKTINFAFTKVKNNVPTITFYLKNGTDPNTKYIYDIEPLDFNSKNNDNVRILAWDWGVNWQKAKIRTKYGKLFKLADNQGVHYYWGNFLIGAVQNVILGGLDIDCNYYKNSSIPDYKNAITCNCTNVEIHNSTLTMNKYCICALGGLNSNISIHDTGFNITDSYVACSVGDLVIAKTDPTIDSALLVEPLAVNTNYYASVSCIIRNNPPDSLINTGGTGFTNSILVVVKSWVN